MTAEAGQREAITEVAWSVLHADDTEESVSNRHT